MSIIAKYKTGEKVHWDGFGIYGGISQDVVITKVVITYQPAPDGSAYRPTYSFPCKLHSISGSDSIDWLANSIVETHLSPIKDLP